ncbi:MAG: hypothetical protein IPP00_03510 [Actinomycetales bacterium]|uniref:Serpin domain-containing protein n=1 Tax=Candidatus Phosphoribacter hodrii TaxID=2953743 RepID=A0A9D7XYH7_9MICO|nr:hypothetical protein [Candidatus Phosphoribacter hodrii]
MNLVDYVAATEAARARINGWTAAATPTRSISSRRNALDPSTRLVLVNAVYLKGAVGALRRLGRPKKAPFTPGGRRHHAGRHDEGLVRGGRRRPPAPATPPSRSRMPGANLP